MIQPLATTRRLIRQQCLATWSAPLLAIALIAVFAVPATAQEAPAPAPGELPPMPPPPEDLPEETPRDHVKLTNFSDRPLELYALRINGTWSAVLTVAAGAEVPIRAGAELGGIPVLGVDAPKQFAIVRYRAYNGWVHWRLAGRQLPGDAAPHWYYMVDSDGNGHLVQSRTEEDAVRVRDQLRSRDRLTAEQLATTKATLRANWVLHDGG